MQETVSKTGEKGNILGYEKIGKLLLKFSLPGIISMLVNSLYNIVDQIFIGQGVGYLGNGATTVIFPLTTIALALSLLIGDGAASYLSLMLGRKKQEEANKAVAIAIWCTCLMGVLLGGLFILFLKPLCLLFGATELILPYAKEYGLIIALGLPFSAISVGFAGFIRADGSPNYNMAGLLAGCITNIILDPIFIFVFNMGVSGAALATIIGQALNAIIYALYIPRLKTVKLSKQTFIDSVGSVSKVFKLGLSSFINQGLIVIIIGVQNNLLKSYGAQSDYGAEIPMTALGVTMKLFNIIMAVLIGLSSGSQPIWGYNYGSGQKDRVKRTFIYSTAIGTAVMLIAFALFQLIPERVVSIFGNDDKLYVDFSVKCLKIYLMLLPLNSIRMIGGALLQATGNSFSASLLALSKQIAIQLPAMILLPLLGLGVDGVLWAGPISDLLSCLFTVVILFRKRKVIFGEKKFS